MMAFVWMALLTCTYIGLYVLNHRTPRPEGCENIDASCQSCSLTTCEHKIMQGEDL